MDSCGEAPTQLLTDARHALRRAQDALINGSAQDVDISSAGLSIAIDRVRFLEARLRTTPESALGLGPEVRALQRDVATVSTLLDQAARYHSNFLRRISEASRNVTGPVPSGTTPGVRIG